MPLSFQPMPHTEARDRIAGLPLVTRHVMDELLPELRAYAFCIAGLDVGDQLSKVRDLIAAVPAGDKTWEKAKREIAAELSDSLGGKESQRRAELLLRTHVFRGYAAARYRNLMQQVDVFPYWQYKTHGDGNVRPSHLALNHKIFPAGHEIWQRIFPPWDWGCRCLVVPLTRGAVERMQDEGMKAPEQDGSLTKTQISKPELYTAREANVIAQAQKLPDGTPLNHAQTWASAPWSIPGNIRHDWPLIQKRYAHDPEVLEAFATWAETTPIHGTASTVRGWLAGESLTAEARWPVVKAPEWADAADVDDWRIRLEAALVPNPTAVTEVLRWHTSGKLALGPVSKARVNRAAQSLLDLLPPEVVQACGPLNLRVVKDLGPSFGEFDPATNTVTLAHSAAAGSEMDVRARVWHEMAHWLYSHADKHPKLKAWRGGIEKHWAERTTLDAPENSGVGWQFLRDKWIDRYAGRLYQHYPPGMEVSAVYFEQIARGPEALAGWMVKDAWRETFDVVASIFTKP